MSVNISYNTNSLQTANILTATIDHFGNPAKNAKLYPLSHANGSKIPFVNYTDKQIKLMGVIQSTSIAALDSLIDTFKSYFIGQDQNLDIDYGGSTRRYIATATNVVVDRPGGLLYANFEVDFECASAFGQDTATTTALNASGRTLSGYTDAYTWLGSAPTQLPIITITFSALTGGVNQSLSFGNNDTGQSLTITRSWNPTDVVSIDVGQRSVMVNGAAADYSGSFPEFAAGAHSMIYNDTFTTRTFAINVIYTPLYL